MNLFQLKSFWCDQSCEPIKMSVSCMPRRVDDGFLDEYNK